MKRLTVAAIITVVAAGVFTGRAKARTTQKNRATGTTAESQKSQDAGSQSSAKSEVQIGNYRSDRQQFGHTGHRRRCSAPGGIRSGRRQRVRCFKTPDQQGQR